MGTKPEKRTQEKELTSRYSSSTLSPVFRVTGHSVAFSRTAGATKPATPAREAKPEPEPGAAPTQQLALSQKDVHRPPPHTPGGAGGAPGQPPQPETQRQPGPMFTL